MTHRRFAGLLVFFLSTATPAISQVFVTELHPVADAYVRSGVHANTNYGTTTELVIRCFGGDFTRKGYMAFDINSIPSGHEIVAATLTLEMMPATPDPGNGYTIRVIVDNLDWDPAVLPETAITYNNAPKNVLLACAFGFNGIRVVGSSTNPTGGVETFDVFAFVAWAVGQNPSYGDPDPEDNDGLITFLFDGFAAHGFALLHSRESTTGLVPKLEITSRPPLGVRYCVANPNSTGWPAGISGWGSPLVAENDVLLRAMNVPANQFGYYLMSMHQDFVPLFGGSQGNLCLGPPIIRLSHVPGGILFSGEAGIMELQLDLTALPQSTVFQPGDVWNFQCWFRDVVGATFTSNTTEGLAITWQ